MKIYLIAIAIVTLFASPVSAQSPNNAVWGVNAQNEVFRWNSARREFEKMPGSLKQVSVGADGAVWGVDSNDDIYRWIGTEWQKVPGNLKQLSVKTAQEVWGVNANDDLFRWNGSTWEPIPGKLAHVSVGADGTLWGISSTTGDILRRNGNNWTTVTRQTVSGRLHRDGTTWTIDPTVLGGGIKLKKITATDAQHVFGVTENGSFARLTGNGWYEFDRGLDVAYTRDGELWEVNRGGAIYLSKDQMASFERMPPLNIFLTQIAVGSASQPTPTGLTAEQQQILDAHNRERRQNYPGVGPLQWSPGLAQAAQEWAEGRAKEGNINHRQTGTNPFKPGEWVGENIYSSSGVATGADAVQWWIDEKQWYHYDQDNGIPDSNGLTSGCIIVRDSAACRERQGYCFCGHFTQVIWKDTQYVGCGKATAANGRAYFVCNYYPGGNNRGQKPY